MKSTKGALIPYKPEPVPTDLPASAQRYLDTELNRIAGFLQGLQQPAVPTLARSLRLTPTTESPASPQLSELIYTDGVSWDPGSGQGYYYWNGMVWTPLG